MNTLPPLPPPPVLVPPAPQPGKGTRLTANDAVGFAISSPAIRPGWPHPFKPRVGARNISLSKGLVDTFEPFIKVGGRHVPISGDRKNPQPALKLDPDVQNKHGESWVCLEVEPGLSEELDDAGKPRLREVLVGDSRVEIIHTDEPELQTPEIGRAALVCLTWREGQIFRVLSVVHFNLRYFRVVPLPGHGGVRHFFR